MGTPEQPQRRDERLHLPDGVSPGEWAIEQFQLQNPRIRSVLGCIQLLEDVLESNYAILHCAPDRLLAIWDRVCRVAESLRQELLPLLAPRSRVPRLEAARSKSEVALQMLRKTVLDDLRRIPEPVPREELMQIRKLLCISIGQLNHFLQETFAELMAADPRSFHDADYFLSRRFPRDFEEAGWLFSTVQELDGYLRELDERRREQFAPALRSVGPRALYTSDVWRPVALLLGTLEEELTARLKGVLALRGIRFSEMEQLDLWTIEIPHHCRLAGELQALLSRRPEKRGAGSEGSDGLAADAARRLREVVLQVDDSLRDLVAFVPVWLRQISLRRALIFRNTETDG